MSFVSVFTVKTFPFVASNIFFMSSRRCLKTATADACNHFEPARQRRSATRTREAICWIRVDLIARCSIVLRYLCFNTILED